MYVMYHRTNMHVYIRTRTVASTTNLNSIDSIKFEYMQIRKQPHHPLPFPECSASISFRLFRSRTGGATNDA